MDSLELQGLGNSILMPFPSDWYFDEEGIHIESGWDENDWPLLRQLPPYPSLLALR